MRLRLPIDLLLVNVSTTVLIIVVSLLPSDSLRIIVGLPFLLFFPGYTLIAALFPRKGALSNMERIALCFGLSITVVPLIGLILNYAWEVKLYSVLTSIGLFIVGTSAVAFYQRWILPEDERFEPRLRINIPWWRENRLDRALNLLLILSVFGAIGTMAYVVSNPKVGESFTEFYMMGREGKAADYPRELTLGEEARLILGIVNQEHEAAEYKVKIACDGETVAEIGPIIVDYKERWEQEVSFAPAEAGPNQKLEFLLYKGTSAEPQQMLRLWVNVNGAP